MERRKDEKDRFRTQAGTMACLSSSGPTQFGDRRRLDDVTQDPALDQWCRRWRCSINVNLAIGIRGYERYGFNIRHDSIARKETQLGRLASRAIGSASVTKGGDTASIGRKAR